jgi:hypothetical protein
VEIGIEGKAKLCLVVLFVVYFSAGLINNSPFASASNSKNNIPNLIIPTCYAMPM